MGQENKHLQVLAEKFASMNDAERLDHAVVIAQRFRQMVDGIRSGDLESGAALHDLLVGAAEALEAITAGRTSSAPEGDGGHDE